MKKLLSTPHEKRIFILGCLSLLLFLFYQGIYTPLKKADSALGDKILLLKKQLNKNLNTISQNKGYDQDYPLALSCYKQTSPDKEQLGLISRELEDLAQDKELQIKTNLPLKSKSTNTTNSFSINISLTGKLNDILEFIYTLQNCPHLYAINEFILDKKSNETSRVQCKLLLTKELIK